MSKSRPFCRYKRETTPNRGTLLSVGKFISESRDSLQASFQFVEKRIDGAGIAESFLRIPTPFVDPIEDAEEIGFPVGQASVVRDRIARS